MSEREIDDSKRILAYNVKLKKKGEPMYNVVINKIITGKRVSYVAKGTTKDGSIGLGSIISATKADEAINAGVAALGEGWNKL